MSPYPIENHQRQVHLDFHTSPYIPDVAKEFDAVAFAAALKAVRVNSVTVFAKCHHGMSYFPTRVGTSHPALGSRDLLGEQLEALHREGIRAPIYTTVVWEEDVASKHPQWRQMTHGGRFASWGKADEEADGAEAPVGMWRFNNFLDPDYQDYVEAHVREICERYGDAVDGFFFDILFFAPNGGWSAASRAFRSKHKLLGTDADTHALFEGLAQQAFCRRFTKLVSGLVPKASVFYNAPNDGNMHPDIGPRSRSAQLTHFEIESLPSGFWGYHHFPRVARAQAHWGKAWLGMTGRFQKMWGDFGGTKPQPALEYECFRAQAMGGACSIGDQLPPRGSLDPAACELIGSVYKKWAHAEPFYKEARPVRPRVGIFSASYGAADGGKSEAGAILLCEEAHYDCVVLDGRDSLDEFSLLILPDSTVVDTTLAAKLEAFLKTGGRLLISYRSGLSPEGEWALESLPLSFDGDVEKYPTYWRARRSFAPEICQGDRVVYARGTNVRKVKGLRVLIDRVLPYFKRSDLKFSSHAQTPPVEKPSKYPALVAGEGFYYFADPIFREYRQTGNQAVRSAWGQVIRDVLGPPAFGAGLPSTVTIYPMRRGDDLLLTLLHYVPVRKALDIDIIDERGSFAGERLRFEQPVDSVIDFETGGTLAAVAEDVFELPARKGRLLLSVPDYFM